MTINYIFSIEYDKECVIHSNCDIIEIMNNREAVEVIEEL